MDRCNTVFRQSDHRLLYLYTELCHLNKLMTSNSQCVLDDVCCDTLRIKYNSSCLIIILNTDCSSICWFDCHEDVITNLKTVCFDVATLTVVTVTSPVRTLSYLSEDYGSHHQGQM